MPIRTRWLLAGTLALCVAAAGLCEGHLPRPWEDMAVDPPGLWLSIVGVLACFGMAGFGVALGRRARPAWVDRFAFDRPLAVGIGVVGVLGAAAFVPVASLGLNEGCQPAFPGSVGLVGAVAGLKVKMERLMLT